MERAINVARYICDEYRKMSGEAIDEMKLHKLLYFSQRESFAITGEPLFIDGVTVRFVLQFERVFLMEKLFPKKRKIYRIKIYILFLM